MNEHTLCRSIHPAYIPLDMWVVSLMNSALKLITLRFLLSFVDQCLFVTLNLISKGESIASNCEISIRPIADPQFKAA